MQKNLELIFLTQQLNSVSFDNSSFYTIGSGVSNIMKLDLDLDLFPR